MEIIYAALLLHKLGKPVNEENMRKVLESTGTKVDDAKIKTLIASLQGIDIGVELENANIAVAAPAAGSAGAHEGKDDKAEKKKEEKQEESAAGLASLFG